MRARYRAQNGVARLAQGPPTNVLSSVVIGDDWGETFVVWHATLEVVSVAGTGEMFFGVRIGGVGQPAGLDRYQLFQTAPGSQVAVFGGGFGVLCPGTVVELLGRMISADNVDLKAGGFVLGVL
jgi:hypothetical protein